MKLSIEGEVVFRLNNPLTDLHELAIQGTLIALQYLDKEFQILCCDRTIRLDSTITFEYIWTRRLEEEEFEGAKYPRLEDAEIIREECENILLDLVSPFLEVAAWHDSNIGRGRLEVKARIAQLDMEELIESEAARQRKEDTLYFN